MGRRQIALAAVPAALALLAGCGEPVDDAYVIENDPGQVEHVEGSDLGRITLTAAAARRLRVETTPVTSARRGRLAVPSAAVFVDPEGGWWVYTNPEPFVYVRHEIEVKDEHNGRTFLWDGPREGVHVVNVGVAELYGVEAEVGH
jgi:hypothetical protein